MDYLPFEVLRTSFATSSTSSKISNNEACFLYIKDNVRITGRFSNSNTQIEAHFDSIKDTIATSGPVG